jgi:hypothetical protein
MTFEPRKYIWHRCAIYKLLWLICRKGTTEVWMCEKQFSALEREELALTPANATEARFHGMAA